MNGMEFTMLGKVDGRVVYVEWVDGRFVLTAPAITEKIRFGDDVSAAHGGPHFAPGSRPLEVAYLTALSIFDDAEDVVIEGEGADEARLRIARSIRLAPGEIS